jgi:hypothetical protein
MRQVIGDKIRIDACPDTSFNTAGTEVSPDKTLSFIIYPDQLHFSQVIPVGGIVPPEVVKTAAPVLAPFMTWKVVGTDSSKIHSDFGSPRYFVADVASKGWIAGTYVVHAVAYEFVEQYGVWDIYRPYTADITLRGSFPGMWRAVNGQGGFTSGGSLFTIPSEYTPSDARLIQDPFPLADVVVPAKPPVSMATGRKYKISFGCTVTGSEGPASDASESTGVVEDGDIIAVELDDINKIIITGDPQIDVIYLYATTDGGTEYYLHSTWFIKNFPRAT